MNAITPMIAKSNAAPTAIPTIAPIDKPDLLPPPDGKAVLVGVDVAVVVMTDVNVVPAVVPETVDALVVVVVVVWLVVVTVPNARNCCRVNCNGVLESAQFDAIVP